MSTEFVSVGDYACAALPIGATIAREAGPFFGPAVHITSIVASFGLKGVEKMFCVKCPNCDWLALSPGEWNYEYWKGGISLVKEYAQKEFKNAIGGKLKAVYHIGELGLGLVETAVRYEDKKQCCKVEPKFPNGATIQNNSSEPQVKKMKKIGADCVYYGNQVEQQTDNNKRGQFITGESGPEKMITAQKA